VESRASPPGQAGETRLCHNPKPREKVERVVAPAAKRQHRKARHVSAGKQKWNKVESRRDGIPVATQTRDARPSTSHTLKRYPHSQLRRERNSNRCTGAEEIPQTTGGYLELLQAGDGNQIGGSAVYAA